MPRLARRSAGSQVQQITEELSDDLLVEENRCFAEIRELFALAVPDLSVGLMEAQAFGGWWTDWQRAVLTVVGQSQIPVAALLDRSTEMCLTAVGAQLDLCEATLARRYAGVAQAGVDWARGEADDVRAMAVDAFRQQSGPVAGYALSSAHRQVEVAQADEELPIRLLSPDLNALPERDGRGVWWHPVPWLCQNARAASIGAGNRVKTLAIEWMNRAHGDR